MLEQGRHSYSTSTASSWYSKELSLCCVQNLLPRIGFPEDEKFIIERIINDTGDLELAGLISFSPGAIKSGLSAIKRLRPLYCDIWTTTLSIDYRLVKDCGCSLSCATTEAGFDSETKISELNLSAKAFRLIKEGLDDSIIVICSSAEPMLEVIDLYKKEGIKPSLVIYAAPGFSGIKESKQALTGCGLEFITVDGTRGGQDIAISAVNSLFKLSKVKERMSFNGH